MIFLPTKEELKELKFVKKRDIDLYEYQVTSKSLMCFDYNIELAHKFYAVEDNEEHLLEFEDREECEYFIKTIKWLAKKSWVSKTK